MYILNPKPGRARRCGGLVSVWIFAFTIGCGNTSPTSEGGPVDVTVARGLLSDEGAVVVVELLGSEDDRIAHRSLRSSLTNDRQVVVDDPDGKAEELRVTFYPCTGACPPEGEWSTPEEAQTTFGMAGAATCRTALSATRQYRASAETAGSPCELSPRSA